MNNNEKLLDDLEAWMVRYGVADSTFGVLSIGDGHLVKRIREGKRIRRSTVLRIRKFMQRYELDVA
jgi:hypothetical protein